MALKFQPQQVIDLRVYLSNVLHYVEKLNIIITLRNWSQNCITILLLIAHAHTDIILENKFFTSFINHNVGSSLKNRSNSGTFCFLRILKNPCFANILHVFHTLDIIGKNVLSNYDR